MARRVRGCVSAFIVVLAAVSIGCDDKKPITPTSPPPPTTTTPAAVTLSGLSIAPATILAGGTVQGTATLSGAAPTGGLVVTLSVPSAAPASVPASITIPAGATSGTFTVTSRGVTTITDLVVTASGGGETRTASLRVTPVPALASLALDKLAVVGGGAASITVALNAAAPAGGTAVTLSSSDAIAKVPASFAITAGATSGTFTITTDRTGHSHDVIITVTVGGVTQTLELKVSPELPEIPTLTSIAPATGPRGNTVGVTLTGTNFVAGWDLSVDVGGSGVTVSNVRVVSRTSMTASFMIASNAAVGARDVTVTIAGRSSNPETFTVTAPPSGPPNRAPVADDDAYAATEDVALSVAASGVLEGDTDADGNALTAVLETGPTNGTLTLNPNGSFIYTPNANFNGSDTFTYHPNDGMTNGNSATVTVAVAAVNDAPPVAVNDNYATNEDAALNVAASGVLSSDSDVDGDSMTAVLGAGPANGSLTLNANGSFTYTPNANFAGSDSFTYRASDGTATSNLATVTITIAQLLDDQTTFTFTAPGGQQTFNVPAGVTVVRIEASGAQGGPGNAGAGVPGAGGNGGTIIATLSVTPLEGLAVFVGEQGAAGGVGVGGAGGFNGGGGGGGVGRSGGGGGGASDVRQSGVTLADRVIVAGGGAGGGGTFLLLHQGAMVAEVAARPAKPV